MKRTIPTASQPFQLQKGRRRWEGARTRWRVDDRPWPEKDEKTLPFLLYESLWVSMILMNFPLAWGNSRTRHGIMSTSSKTPMGSRKGRSGAKRPASHLAECCGYPNLSESSNVSLKLDGKNSLFLAFYSCLSSGSSFRRIFPVRQRIHLGIQSWSCHHALSLWIAPFPNFP